MRRAWFFIAVVIFLVGLGRPAGAGQINFIEQTGTVSATANGSTVTDTLTQQSGGIEVTAGEETPGSDFAEATLQSQVDAHEIQLQLTANVGEWGNEGAAEARIIVVFSVDTDTGFMVAIEDAEATGSGWLGYRAFITLSNDAGIIFRRNVGGGYDACSSDHPDGDICENRILTPDVYYFELIASAYAPGNCGSCKGFAVTAVAELTVTFP